MSSQNETKDKTALNFVTFLPIATLIIAIAIFLAPLSAAVALPALLLIAVHHVMAMARTQGSLMPFALLLGVDISLIIVVIWLLIP